MLRVEDCITKTTPIPTDEKLAITLRYLATRETYESLMYQFRMRHNLYLMFVPHVCKEIYNCMEGDYLNMSEHACIGGRMDNID